MPIVPSPIPSYPVRRALRMTRSTRSSRRGVTLIELLVVLVLLAVTAAIVLPALTPPAAASDDDPAATVVASARRLAIRRGEPLRLRIDTDGVWALVTLHDGVALDGGRFRRVTRSGDNRAERAADNTTTGAGIALVLTIDALGSCQPGDQLAHGESYNPLTCRWSRSVSQTAAMHTFGAR